MNKFAFGRQSLFWLVASAFLICGQAFAGLITSTVNGPSGTSEVQFSLATSTLVVLSATADTGFMDPCLSATDVCSYNVFEQSWIPGSASSSTSATEICLSQGNCDTNQMTGAAASVTLGPGIYWFVVSAQDSPNTGVQSVTATLNIDGDFQVIPEPGTNTLMGSGLLGLASLCAILRRRPHGNGGATQGNREVI